MTSLKAFQIGTEEQSADLLKSARRVLFNEEMALKALGQSLNDEFVKAIHLIEAAEGRIIVTGMGKSGHVGRKIAATMASTGTPAFFVHPGEASHGDLGMIVRGDVVIALSNSGEAKELNDLIAYTRRFAIPLIGVTSKAQSTLGTRSDVTLLLPPCPEACPNGLAPTTSTTMTLALGDALAVVLLERKGFSEKDFRVFHPGGKLGQQLMAVKDIMHVGERLPLAPKDLTMKEILPIMTAKGFGMIGLIDEAGSLAGVITDGDIRRHISADFLTQKAATLMNAKPVTVDDQALVGEVVGVMNDVQGRGRKITCLFVLDAAQKPIGIVHMHDCLKAGFI